MLLYLDNAHVDRARIRWPAGAATRASTRISAARSSSCTRSASMAATRRQDVEALGAHPHGLVGGAAQGDRRSPGSFHFFRERAHEPGAEDLARPALCRERRAEEGVAALRDLAAHPATARHIATKLARHFIADGRRPTRSSASRRVFTRQRRRSRHASPPRWSPRTRSGSTPFAKLRTPSDLRDRRLPRHRLHAAGRRCSSAACACSTSRRSSRRSRRAGPTMRRRGPRPRRCCAAPNGARAFADRMPDPPDPVALAAGAPRRGAAGRDAAGDPPARLAPHRRSRCCSPARSFRRR